ncbi:hypothetical protein Lepto7376_2274 [[Leptolyngbya] sp. PCC 7376]|uniref:hypothetical protein n=1 Tax=[Leptolyngbya] sp. PCC 7376 TaxID=111781 RepID=UPI00029ED297|nr:hypothetical protein [[Leptolyngbya] sp. PCC 7376]AFY38564.1 hypothetical protein Lepto7376_2274 [[Leptolyngbya] sp. PCC 7376]
MIEIIFDGSLAVNHKVSMRTLGMTYTHIQKALERAYIDIERDGIFKNERLKKEDYYLTEFFLESTANNCYRVSFREATQNLKRTIDRVSQAIFNPYDLAISDAKITHQKVLEQVKDREGQSLLIPKSYQDILSGKSEIKSESYGSKSIISNINQAIIPVRKSQEEGSITLRLNGEQSSEYHFDTRISTRFSTITSYKELGPEMLCECYLLMLNPTKTKGKVKHTYNGKESTLFFVEHSDCNQVLPFLEQDENGRPKKSFSFIGHVVKESGVLNVETGDVIFKRLAS